MLHTIRNLFLLGIIGLLFSWAALFYRYKDNGSRTAQIYKLPTPPKLEHSLALNEKLQNVEYILKDEIHGPESILVEGDSLYTGLHDGRVVHIRKGTIIKEVRFSKHKSCGTYEMEPVCGRPLGIRRLNDEELVVADAYLGIFIVDMDSGAFNQIIDTKVPINGQYLRFVNDVEVLNEDEIVFTVTSSKWDRRRFLHIIFENEPNGRIYKHKISTSETTVLADKLHMPNGIQLHPDGNSLLFAECNRARIDRLDLSTNKVMSFATNLPGLPDNIRLGDDNTIWVALPSVRHIDAFSMVDWAGSYPLVRQILMDLIPAHWWAKYMDMKIRPRHAMVIQLNEEGQILQSLHDPSGDHVQDVSEVSQYDDYLYLGSFHNKYIAKVYIGK